jgi:Ser/Thr protein kinase RdoA (MazF antagonist)
MNSLDHDVSCVLSAYPEGFAFSEPEFLGSAGGFSGAQFWKVSSNQGLWCLRRWPKESPTREELEFIHAVLEHVWQQGVRRIPTPLRNIDNQSYTCQGGYFWELTPWLPGEADFYRNPSSAKLVAAVKALAEFHVAAASLPTGGCKMGISPGLCRRRERLWQWLKGDLLRLAESITPEVWPELQPLARRVVQLVPRFAADVLGLLERPLRLTVRLQPCIVDIWHDHVLFEGQQVTGLVDFGSMRIDHVSCDLARLLGSMAGDDVGLWQAGLAAYQRAGPLSETEMHLVIAFDRSTVLMSGLNWIDWIYRQGRVFEDRHAILCRLEQIVDRLENLGPRGGNVTGCVVCASRR